MKYLGKIWILMAMAVVIGLPFLLKKPGQAIDTSGDTVVIITPHTESIRQEFGYGFREWYKEKTGREMYVDFRVIGGTSEIAKFLKSEYSNSFRNYWVNELGNDWNLTVQESFDNGRIHLDDTPEDDMEAEAARRAYLASEVSSGIDVFFGGGAYDYTMQAEAGNLVSSGLMEKHPEWFQEKGTAGVIPDAIPREIAGETLYDAEGRWFGAVLSSYGIIYNRKVLKQLGIDTEPRQWADLADSRYFGQIAVCDPTKSGSMTQAFEMIVQQQMQLRLVELKETSGENADIKTLEEIAVREGWDRGMKLIQKISANARYFTDTSQKTNIDVAMGDCAAGMSIDFYGRFQQENILERSGDTRFGFWTPKGGSTISADPIGLLRGAPHKEAAQLFIEYVMSLEGQKLWNFKVGVPGGPRIFALRRPPIRPQLYKEEWNQYRSDEDYIPYVEAKDFAYRSDWTGRLFSELRTIIRISFIDVRPELTAAWKAIIDARKEGRAEQADKAEAILQNLDAISFEEASTTIDAVLKAPKIEEVRLGRELSEHFRAQYLEAQKVATGL